MTHPRPVSPGAPDSAVPIARTKLYAPGPDPRRVARPQVLERLAGWQAKKLSLVSAPPGFGKTSLVGEWVGGLTARVGWVSLDRSDDDPVRFWTLLGHALEAIARGILPMVERWLQSPAPAYPALVTAIANRLAEHPGPGVLVLDDYHAITRPAIHDAVLQLLDAMPPHVHLVLTTREDPPFPLARLRARGLLSEVRAADLRFAQQEAAAFLNERMGLTLPEADVAALAKSTEGWVTGLQLAALSLQQAEDPGAFVAAFAGSNRYLLDYLIEEALRHQPEALQRFMMQASVLERMSGPLCDHLLGTSGSQALLERLEQANLFLVPLDDARRWYRFHHLFADMLRHQLAQRDPAAVPALHLKASEWFEREGLLGEAVPHALAGKHHERAADLIASAEPLLRRGEVQTVLDWLEALPPALRQRRADLLLLEAWILFPTGRREALERLAQDAERALDASEPLDAPLRAQLLALQAFAARTKGELALSLALSERSLAVLPRDDWMWRPRVALNLATAYQQYDRTDEALATFDAARDAIRAQADAYHETLALALKGTYLLELGRLSAARALFEEALAVAEAHHGRGSGVASYAWVGLGLLFDLQDRPEDAALHLRTGLAGAAGAIEPAVRAWRALAGLAFRRGEHQAAEAIWQQGIAVTRDLRLGYFERYLRAHRATCTREDLGALEEWLALARSRDATRPIHGPLEDGGLLLARAHLALAQRANGIEALGLVLEKALDARRTPLAVEVLVQQACLTDDATEARVLVARAMALAAPEGLYRTFVDARATLAPRIEEVARDPRTEEPACGFAAKLLASAPASAARSVGTLSDREHEVLGAIAEGLTNLEIARRLCIEVSTVKRHVTNLCVKLDASNRTQAVARARDAGLL